MTPVTYINGDATNPQAKGNKIIVHICNDIGAWGKGFVLAISRKWKAPEKAYREWHKTNNDFALGNVQLIQVAEDIWIANMIGQHKIYKDKAGNAPIRYDATEVCLHKVAVHAKELTATVHMPRIGCGLAGGKWEQMEPIIQQTLSTQNIQVTVYDF